MKANRKFVMGQEAVSPVIAVILMVAITVVLAATVYLFVSGFGSDGQKVVTASFAAKTVDMPLGGGTDTDNSDDVIEITYASGSGDLALGDVKIILNGLTMTNNASGLGNGQVLVTDANGDGNWNAGDWCTTHPGADQDASWERGAVLYLRDTGTASIAECADGAGAVAADWATSVGIHQLKVIVQNQVVLDTTIEVHDNLAT